MNKKAVIAHRGEVYAGVLGRNDVVYFKISKKELLYQMAKPDFNEQFELSIVDGDLYVDNKNTTV